MKAKLHVGHVYRAAFHLGWVESKFAGQIPGKLSELGFQSVRMFDDASTLPAVFGDLVRAPDANHWAEGLYQGQEGAEHDLPSQIIAFRDDGLGNLSPTAGNVSRGDRTTTLLAVATIGVVGGIALIVVVADHYRKSSPA